MKDQTEILSELEQLVDATKTTLRKAVMQQNAILEQVYDDYTIGMKAIWNQNFKVDERFIVQTTSTGLMSKAMTEANANAEKSRQELAYPDEQFTVEELQLTAEGQIIEGVIVVEE